MATTDTAPSAAEQELAELRAIAEEEREQTDSLELPDYQPKSEDEATLCRFLRRRFQVEQELIRVRDQMETMRKSLESRLRGLDYIYLPILEPMVSKMIAGTKKKSVQTPWGKAGFRTLQPRLEVTNEEALLAAAEANLLLAPKIVVKKSIPKSVINDHFKSTGEIPDGVELVPGRDKFYAE